MPRNPVRRNAPCPCGSGKKYKQCCIKKDIEWLEDDEGNVFKSIPISDEMSGVFELQQQKFVEQFGREPGPDDKIFFDAPPLEHVEHEIAQTMKKAGIHPALIYAFEKTGRIVSEENEHLLSDVELAEWEAAITEYQDKHGDDGPSERGRVR